MMSSHHSSSASDRAWAPDHDRHPASPVRVGLGTVRGLTLPSGLLSEGMPLDAAKVDALLARARREIDDGLLPSCQVALAFDGELVAFETYGDATPDTRYAVFSATKALVAAAVWSITCSTVMTSLPLVPNSGM